LNRFLFDTLTFLNGFIAVIIILGAAVTGWSSPMFRGAPVMGGIAGALVGITMAALVCGAIAFLALIERHLHTIAEKSQPDHGAAAPATRQEPRM
jgi:hypothetical protein